MVMRVEWTSSPKVNVFIWKLARDILPTRHTKFIRKMEASNICPLCSREVESSYHATVTCPQSRGLRMAMRDHWQLPAESQFRYTGPDWILLLLDQCSDSLRDQVKLLLWKTWAVHNNITHQAGPTSISEAVHALCAMQSTFSEELPAGDKVGGKGKAPYLPCDNRKQRTVMPNEMTRRARWEPAPPGWVKCNVDGSFVPQTGEAGVGVGRAHHSDGRIILTA
jgi:hypothetical protein